MILNDLLGLDLRLFDGGAGDGGNGAGGPGETPASSAYTQQSTSGDTQRTTSGVQATGGEASDAGKQETADPETRRKAFLSLANGEYKDVYTKEVQRIVNERFKDHKALEKKVGDAQPLIDLLMYRYGIEDGDVSKLTTAVQQDDTYLMRVAQETGMTVEQIRPYEDVRYKYTTLLRQEEARRGAEAAARITQKWDQEAEELRAGPYPQLDLAAEAKNEQFVSLLRSGVSVKTAYEVIHHDELLRSAAEAAAKDREKQVMDNLKAKGARPTENGASSKSGFTMRSNVSDLNVSEIEEIARRVANGERVSLG